MKNLKKPARLPRKAPSNQTGGTAWGKKLAAEFSRMVQSADMKKLILLNFPYIIAFYMVEKAAWLYRHCNGDSVVDRLMVLFMNFGLAYKSVLPSCHPFDLLIGLVGAAALKAVIYFKGKNAKKYRQGEEYGSARWGNQKDIEPFIDPVFENNVILTQTERLMMSGRPKHPKYARNKNVIVIGGSGSGKTRFYVKPNLMQMPQKVSYVVTDPKGTIIIECGKMLSDAGYKIKVLNTINFKKSMRYNPFHYIRSEKDILKLVNTIIANTKGDGEKSGEDFWIKAERLLYCALIGYIWYKSKKNNNDRTQYRQKNHHEAIVSREVFNAANHLRASRNYSKKNRPLPVLSVVEDGILRGYVPFDKDWTGFSAEEYREASESVMKEPDVTVTADVKKRLDLTGYEIVRVQYFSTMQNPAMTISNGRLRFNTACLKKFENVEYVELLLNSVERCIAIRPCDKNNPNAIRWGRLKEGRWCASTLGCRGLAKTLFDIMEWDEDLRYRFRGQFLEQGDNKMMLFAFDEPEMIKVEEIVLPPKENTEEDEGETVKKKIYIFPPEWAGTFGQPITSIAQVGILRQEHYAGNWDVFRPATEIEEMNIFTAESLNELLREAEKIMEGWTDYR